MTILSTMRQFVPVYLQNINICLSHVPTPRGRREKEAGRVCGGCVCPLYHGSGRACVCACVCALKVARGDGLAGGACRVYWWMVCDCVAMYSICMCGGGCVCVCAFSGWMVWVCMCAAMWCVCWWCVLCGENESELVPKTNQKPIRKYSKKPRFPRCW